MKLELEKIVNGVQVQTESLPLKTGDSQLQEALKTQKILYAPESDLTGVLRYAMLLVGLRAQNLPSAEETAVLFQFIRFNYSGHTVAEIKLAFDLAMTGKLEVDAKCYENFSCEYFGRIMSAYRGWATPKVVPIKSEVKQIEAPVDWTDFVQSVRDRIRAGTSCIIPSVVYDWLEEKGEISFSKEEKHVFLKQAKAEYARELHQGIISGNNKPADKFMLERIHTEDFYKDRELLLTLQVRAKVLAVKKYLA